MNVFGITELFDMILPLVDEHDLLRLQQVCHLFDNRINDDILSQRRLFLSPSGSVIDNTRERTTEIDTDTTTLKFNPFLTKISIWPFIDWSDFISRTKELDTQPHVPKIQEWDLDNKHLCLYPPTDSRIESRWNDMFITQPPITAIAMMLPKGKDYKEGATAYPQDIEVRNLDGLTVGDIVREWKKATEGNDYLSEGPLCIVTYAWSSYERFYSAYRKVLMQYNTFCAQRAQRVELAQTAQLPSRVRPRRRLGLGCST